MRVHRACRLSSHTGDPPALKVVLGLAMLGLVLQVAVIQGEVECDGFGPLLARCEQHPNAGLGHVNVAQRQILVVERFRHQSVHVVPSVIGVALQSDATTGVTDDRQPQFLHSDI